MPLAVGVTTRVIVGIGMGAPEVRAVAGATLPVATTGREGSGVPAGLTVPWATTVLLGLIEAIAGKGLVAGWETSHTRVTVELGVGRVAGVRSSMVKVTVEVGVTVAPVVGTPVHV
ncbi:hypothetical protein [Nonomuraea sp. NPDC050783]|uniref:hypothetical protein n=1 Tax=Nonomuraea sp. NPDC050783 TaxID=3154634 RepID=UPI003467B8F7